MEEPLHLQHSCTVVSWLLTACSSSTWTSDALFWPDKAGLWSLKLLVASTTASWMTSTKVWDGCASDVCAVHTQIEHNKATCNFSFFNQINAQSSFFRPTSLPPFPLKEPQQLKIYTEFLFFTVFHKWSLSTGICFSAAITSINPPPVTDMAYRLKPHSLKMQINNNTYDHNKTNTIDQLVVISVAGQLLANYPEIN